MYEPGDTSVESIATVIDGVGRAGEGGVHLNSARGGTITCEQGTGRFDIGTHFILKTEQDQERNTHLGPAHLVKGVADLLSEGDTVTAYAFRTEKMAYCQHSGG